MNNEQLAVIVRRHLDEHKPAGVPIDVIEAGIRQDGDFWYVPVRLTGEIPRRYRYYEDLTDAEEDIKEQEHIDVLFVPSG